LPSESLHFPRTQSRLEHKQAHNQQRKQRAKGQSKLSKSSASKRVGANYSWNNLAAAAAEPGRDQRRTTLWRQRKVNLEDALYLQHVIQVHNISSLATSVVNAKQKVQTAQAGKHREKVSRVISVRFKQIIFNIPVHLNYTSDSVSSSIHCACKLQTLP
jgi:hypothetical protein